MKIITYITILALFAVGCATHNADNAANDRKSLEKTTAAIRDAFARGDVPAIVSLHHPDIQKYFGGDNVVNGRAGLEKQLKDIFRASKMEFIGNRIESTLFYGETAIETGIFNIKITPQKGGNATFARGRSMVVYVRYKESPTGWASIREMIQAAPAEN